MSSIGYCLIYDNYEAALESAENDHRLLLELTPLATQPENQTKQSVKLRVLKGGLD